ncbi:MAG: hypothetical protein JW844_07075 [Candidatus Omnitrophica bacterium]|nr:hypothetical protein [Candidatus Omnitrophota bacterium]
MKCQRCGAETDTLWLSRLWLERHGAKALYQEGVTIQDMDPELYLCDLCYDSEQHHKI